MDIIWDPDKAKLNRIQHRVSFPDAAAVLHDPYAITREDKSAEGEQRLVSLGLDALGRLLIVVYTYRDEAIRRISARRATRTETRTYESGI